MIIQLLSDLSPICPVWSRAVDAVTSRGMALCHPASGHERVGATALQRVVW